MTEFDTDFGKRLFELLPVVHRSRDNGDLAAYLDGCGRLLDLLDQTLRQRLTDAFPDNPPAGRLACQEWLLPYFAGLLDVRLVSPHARGRREEIGNAVAWRQRKGTSAVVEQVAEAVAQMEVEIQEGWLRVIVTPRIGLPLLSARTLGYGSEPVETGGGRFAHPALGARHPGLPAATVDLRCPSRAVESDENNPAAKSTRFGADGTVFWRQASRHGAPCFPDSFEDVSRRTVDIRTPDFARGHHHPRRLLLYAPPPAGFFPDPGSPVDLPMDAAASLVYTSCPGSRDAYCAKFKSRDPVEGVLDGDRGLLQFNGGADSIQIPVMVTGVSGLVIDLKGAPPPDGMSFPVAADRVRLRLQDRVTIRWNQRHESRFQELLEQRSVVRRETAGDQKIQLVRNRTLDTDWFVPVRVLGRIDLDSPQTWRFEGLTLANTLAAAQGRVELEETAAFRVEVQTADTGQPVVDAKNSLIRTLVTPDGLSRLEYCTVLDPMISAAVQASDTLFLGILRQSDQPLRPPSPACLRYSRFPRRQITTGVSIHRCTTDPVELFSTTFGDRGCGVLHPATAATVRFGAEDGGEMGAYHGRRYSLQAAAVLDKLTDFLPVGIEAVLIPDTRLLEAPPPLEPGE